MCFLGFFDNWAWNQTPSSNVCIPISHIFFLKYYFTLKEVKTPWNNSKIGAGNSEDEPRYGSLLSGGVSDQVRFYLDIK